MDRPKRPKNAAATRQAILHSALAAFSRHGYDGIGVREIAQAAGVTGVLVNRYFGSKEELFAAAVELAFADKSVFEGDSSMLAQRLTAKVMKTEKDLEPNDAFFLLLRSAPNPRAAEILRDSIARHFERPLQASLRGPRPAERAGMILAVCMGLSLFRTVIGSKALTEANVADLSGDLSSLFQGLIAASAGRRPPARKSHRKKHKREREVAEKL